MVTATKTSQHGIFVRNVYYHQNFTDLVRVFTEVTVWHPSTPSISTRYLKPSNTCQGNGVASPHRKCTSDVSGHTPTFHQQVIMSLNKIAAGQ